MKLVSLRLKDFRGIQEGEFTFGDFTCFVGPNGYGKTTILEAVSLLCSSLDFAGDAPVMQPLGVGQSEGDKDALVVNNIAEKRLTEFLKKNIRNEGEDNACSGFRVEGTFEHEGITYDCAMTEKGAEKDMTGYPFWWPGICFFTKFDVEMSKFQLRADLWPKFKKSWDAITGYPACDPEIMTFKALAKREANPDYVINFKIDKPTEGVRQACKVPCRRASAGEKKIIKSLSQIVNLEIERQPHIVLIDNAEMHIHWTRHLKAIQELKDIFAGKQIVSATHSLPIINDYHPKSDIIDLGCGYKNNNNR